MTKFEQSKQEIKPISPTEDQIDIEQCKKLSNKTDEELWQEEAQERTMKIPPIDIIKINENTSLKKILEEGGGIDRKNIISKQDAEKFRIFYLDEEKSSFNGQLVEKTVGSKSVRILIHNDSSLSPYSSYLSLVNIYTIGPKLRKEFKELPELGSYLVNHEVTHDKYSSLNEKQQKEIDDLFLNDGALLDILKRFAMALYTDKSEYNATGKTYGETYLKNHTKQPVLSFFIAPEGQKGIKDVRSITFNIDGQKKEIFVGLLISELIAHLQLPQMGKNVFDKIIKRGETLGSGHLTNISYIIRRCYDYIRNNRKASDQFKKFKLLEQEPEIEQLFISLLKNSPK